MNTAQRMFLADGNGMMLWLWSHADFCPDLSINWVGCLVSRETTERYPQFTIADPRPHPS